MMILLKNIYSFLFEKDKYLFLSLFLLVFIKIIIVLIYGYLNKPIEINGDGLEYIYVAESLIKGDGFISNENNIYERAYLGDNHYFSDSPVFPLVLVPFLYILKNDIWIILSHNLLFHFLLVILFLRMCNIFRIHRCLILIGLMFLIFNSSLNFYGITLTPSVFRTFTLFSLFYLSFGWLDSLEVFNLKKIIFFSFIVGISILSREPFVIILIPIFISIVLNKGIIKKVEHIFMGLFIVSLVLLPWSYRNYHTFGIFNFSTNFSRPFNTDTIVMDNLRLEDNEKFRELKKLHNNRIPKFDKSEKGISKISKHYFLKFFEFFRLYPSGGPASSIINKIISFLFNFPYIFGLILLYTSKVFMKNRLWVFWKICIVFFIIFHLIGAGAHARYFIPLIPLGYIFTMVFINSKISSRVE